MNLNQLQKGRKSNKYIYLTITPRILDMRLLNTYTRYVYSLARCLYQPYSFIYIFIYKGRRFMHALCSSIKDRHHLLLSLSISENCIILSTGTVSPWAVYGFVQKRFYTVWNLHSVRHLIDHKNWSRTTTLIRIITIYTIWIILDQKENYTSWKSMLFETTLLEDLLYILA